LKQLVVGDRGDDPYEELKGNILQACWPDYITAKELFLVLTPPQRPNFSGSYRRFLSSQPIHYLQPADLPLALHWIETYPTDARTRSMSGDLNKIMDMIVEQAWDYLEESEVLDRFARAILVTT